MYQEGDRFTVDNVSWTAFTSPALGCDYAVFTNEGPNDVEYRQDSTRALTGKTILALSQQTITAARSPVPDQGTRAKRFPAGTVIGSFRALAGTAAIFPTLT